LGGRPGDYWGGVLEEEVLGKRGLARAVGKRQSGAMKKGGQEKVKSALYEGSLTIPGGELDLDRSGWGEGSKTDRDPGEGSLACGLKREEGGLRPFKEPLSGLPKILFTQHKMIFATVAKRLPCRGKSHFLPLKVAGWGVAGKRLGWWAGGELHSPL